MTFHDFSKIAGVVILCAAPIGTFAVAQDRINNMKDELKDHSESIDENEEFLQQLQTTIIIEQGQQAVELESIKGDVRLILRLLEQQIDISE